MRFIIFWFFLVSLSGCASTTGTFFNRPVVEDRVGDVIHTVSLSADRRTVVVAGKDNPTPKFCAEPPPDTATALKTDLDATLTAKGADLGVKDKFDTSVTVLSSRNAPLDAFRTGMFALCQFYMNGAIEKGEVKGMFTQLLQTYERTQNIVSESSKPQVSSAAATPATPATPAAVAGTAVTTTTTTTGPAAAPATPTLETKKASR